MNRYSSILQQTYDSAIISANSRSYPKMFHPPADTKYIYLNSIGKYYLKVGHDYDLNRPMRSKEEVASWYRAEGQNRLEDFKSIYLRIYQSVTGKLLCMIIIKLIIIIIYRTLLELFRQISSNTHPLLPNKVL